MKNKLKFQINSKRQIAFYITCILAIFTIGGYLYYGRVKEKIVQQKEKTLTAIATLKAKQIEMWYKEELKDVQEISANPYLEEVVKTFVRSNSTIDRTSLSELLKQIQKEHESSEVLLTSLDGGIIAYANSQITPIYPDELSSLNNINHIKGSVSTSFFNSNQNGDNKLYISFISTVNWEGNNLSYAIIVRQDAADDFFPLIENWPIESQTGESFIFCYESQNILLNNELKHQAEISIKEKLPFSNEDLLSKIYTSRQPGIYLGKDYRNNDVLASMQAIDGTEWVLISKIAKSELLQDLNREALSIIIMVLFFVALSGLLIVYLFNIRQKNIYKGLLEKERELWAQQEKFNVVMDSIGDGIITVDLNGNIKYLNNRAEELTGWKLREALGRDFHEVYNVINEETRQQKNDIVNKVLNKGLVKELSNHTILISKNGTEIPVMDTGATLFDESGQIIGIVISFQDETENRNQNRLLKLSEEKYRILVKNIPQKIFVKNLELSYIYCNENFAEDLGITSDEIVGKTDYDFFSKEMADKYRNDDRFILEKEETITLEEEYQAKDISFWVKTTKTPIKDENGRIIGLLGIFEDITEKIRAQTALLKSEAKYREFFEADLTGVYIATFEGKLLNCNPAFIEIMGCNTTEDIIGRNIIEFYQNPADRQEFLNLIQNQKKLRDYKSKLKRKDGANIICVENIVGNFDENGKMIKYNAYLYDITDKTRAEEELRKKEQLLSSVMETQQELICRFLPDTTLIFVNKVYCNVLRRSEQELIGSKFLEFVPKDEWEGILSVLKNLHADNPSHKYVSSVSKQDGSAMFVEWTDIAILNEQNEVIEIQGVGWDITEKLKADKELIYQTKMQELLRKIALNYINIPLEIVDSTIQKSLEEIGKFVNVDRAYVFDYDWHNGVCNNTYEWCGNGITPQINNLQNILLDDIPFWVNPHKEGKAIIIPDVNALHESDKVRHILESQAVKSLIAIPLMDEYTCIGFLGFDSVLEHHKYKEKEELLLFVFAQMLVNIQKRNVTEQNLIKAKEKAEESDKLKTAFINNISHEIRTPLNTILGFGGLLAEMELTQEEKKVMLAHVQESSDRLLNTVNDYVDIAMIVSGTMEVHKKEFQLYPFFDEIVEKTRRLCAEKDIELETETPKESFDLILESDPKFILKTLNILLDNAVKFTDKGSIKCEYKVNNGFLEFFVQDSGLGIAHDKLEMIFKKFEQEETSNTRGYEGSGLGLTIASGLVNLLGGTISATSEKGKGSIFTFTVPYNKS